MAVFVLRACRRRGGQGGSGTCGNRVEHPGFANLDTLVRCQLHRLDPVGLEGAHVDQQRRRDADEVLNLVNAVSLYETELHGWPGAGSSKSV